MIIYDTILAIAYFSSNIEPRQKCVIQCLFLVLMTRDRIVSIVITGDWKCVNYMHIYIYIYIFLASITSDTSASNAYIQGDQKFGK